jgi:hypothetical protein
MKLPIHCCCEPGKRLGYINLPDAFRKGDIVLRRSGELSVAPADPTAERRVDTIHTEVGWILCARGPFLAVKSAHLPIEEWRKIPGFSEQ